MKTTNKINRSEVMKNAWMLFKSQNVKTSEMFGICLKQAWNQTKNKTFSFENVYKEHNKKTLNYIKFKVKSNFEDVHADAWIKINKYLPAYNPNKGAITTFIYSIINSVIVDYFRANKNENNTYNVSDFHNPETGKEYFQIIDTNQTNPTENKEVKKEVYKAIKNLKGINKKIAIMYFLHQYQYNEISEKLNISMSNVKVSIFRIRETLQNELKHIYTN